jgi:Tol biopolymer transport system component
VYNGVLDGPGAFLVSPDSRHVVYLADQDTNGVTEIYSVPIDRTTAPVKRNGPGQRVVYSSSCRPRITPDSARVLYVADQADGRNELFTTSITGTGDPTRVSHPMSPLDDVLSFEIAALGSQALYAARDDTDPPIQLYHAPPDASRPAQRIATGIFQDARLSARGRFVLYLSDQDTAGVQELYTYALPRHPQLAPSPEGGVTVLH